MGASLQNNNLYQLVTIEDVINELPDNTIYKEIINEQSIKKPNTKPPIQQLSKIVLKPTITSYKKISTPHGPKLIIKGTITERVFYVADNESQTVHCINFTFPICTFIKVKNKVKSKKIKIKTEEIVVQLQTKEKFYQCILLCLYAIP
ncbi:SPOCS domain-containing protein [Halanaerobacter jeridensis]|uniref:SipL SPOCS domain-containing protein n=1 Tax=Halanaerobacter jeridensis TaxID=706427 RepID=A0A938XP83_9FIRM|nr:SPOCS domain-containing protein [Halanaerobacter jeridensis]MBM7556618.1 hypothetical protein [Halanaerobacter jeridensis]